MVVGVTSGNGQVPSALPPILKNFTKAAIRTQPKDVISWAYVYFRSLLDGESPPVKEQIEFPLPQTESGITPGLLRVLHKKLGPLEVVPRSQFEDLCQALGVKDWAVKDAWSGIGEDEEGPWDQILIGLISTEGKTPQEKLTYVMQTISEDSMSKRVSLEEVLKYFYLIHPENSEDNRHEEVKEYLSDVASYQDGYLIPSDLSRPSCPLNDLM